MNNPPDFHIEHIPCISSINRDGFDHLGHCLEIAISRLPKVKLQDHWKDTMEWVLTANENKDYIKFEDLLKNTTLQRDEVVSMLKALVARGRIVWADTDSRREIIYHRIEILAIIMKSIFFHEMEPIIKRFALLRGVNQDMFLEEHSLGKVPLEVFESMLDSSKR